MSLNKAELRFFQLLADRQEGKLVKPIEQQTIAEIREGAQFFNEFCGEPDPDVSAKNGTVPARDAAAIPIRIFNAELPEDMPCLVFFPGTGYSLDLFEANAVACSRIAKHAGIKAIVVNYRLAPENAFPKSVEDCFDAVKYICKHKADFGIGDLYLGGFSSGAHAAAVVSYQAVADSDIDIKQQVLIAGFYDMTTSNTDFAEFEQHDKITSRAPNDHILALLGVDPDKRSDPTYSPVYQEPQPKLPRTTFIIPQFDGLRSDSEHLFAKYRDAGVDVARVDLEGQSHSTIMLPPMQDEGADPAHAFAEVLIKAKIKH